MIATRRSDRDLSRAPLRETGNLLAFATAERARWGGDLERTSRPSHSAGALHATHVLILTGSRRLRVFRYDTDRHELQQLNALAPPLARLRAKLSEMFPDASSDALIMLADAEVMRANYDRPESLIWRDAGAVMQTIHFCATAYRMGFCPAGISGRELREALALSDDRLIPTGAAIVGRVRPRL